MHTSCMYETPWSITHLACVDTTLERQGRLHDARVRGIPAHYLLHLVKGEWNARPCYHTQAKAQEMLPGRVSLFNTSWADLTGSQAFRTLRL